jgi:hypothetical protein
VLRGANALAVLAGLGRIVRGWAVGILEADESVHRRCMSNRWVVVATPAALDRPDAAPYGEPGNDRPAAQAVLRATSASCRSSLLDR